MTGWWARTAWADPTAVPRWHPLEMFENYLAVIRDADISSYERQMCRAYLVRKGLRHEEVARALSPDSIAHLSMQVRRSLGATASRPLVRFPGRPTEGRTWSSGDGDHEHTTPGTNPRHLGFDLVDEVPGEHEHVVGAEPVDDLGGLDGDARAGDEPPLLVGAHVGHEPHKIRADAAVVEEGDRLGGGAVADDDLAFGGCLGEEAQCLDLALLSVARRSGRRRSRW